MAFTFADLVARFAGDTSAFDKSLDKSERKTRSWANNASKMIGGAVVGGAAIAGAALIGLGTAALGIEGDFKKATDALINGTGASGDALEDMEERVKSLKGSTAGLGMDLETIGATMAEVNTRTGATGDALEDLTGQVLEFTRLAGGDAVSNTQLLTRTMGDWGVETENAGKLLDQLYGAGQAFGIGFDSLTQKLVQFGAPLRQMGFGLEESIALFGKWEKEGVNAELAIGSLRIAAGKFAREGVDLASGLDQVQESIKNAATESEGLNIAMEYFGARAGPDMAAAIREGRFELDEAVESLRNTEGGLADAAERTIGFREEWAIAMSSMQVALLPLGEALGEFVSAVMPSVVTFIQGTLAPAFEQWTTDAIEWLTGSGGLIPAIQAAGQAGTWQGLLDYLADANEQFVYLRDIINDVTQALDWLNQKKNSLNTWMDNNLPKWEFDLGERVHEGFGQYKDLAVVNPVNTGGMPADWVGGGWSPQVGTGDINVNVNVVGADPGNAARTGAGAGVDEAMKARGN